ncbi:HNH endonuclease [Mycobacterium avium]|uniref:HNH endonuclease n=1 Tax=Mycobacterium avium TaxID=1764 RepID=UPI001131A102|nr:HNH endonuclease [Mycobacterium avium subsp. hominissuis]WOF20783.1 HNH endonuclease [Mycobacterium avium]MBZ4516309.1 HNH endonuclease [Mycobacterium avium subsp. hominissuis]MBZ4545846.1 HNH endonuclease [Mycobacterium avium subsp. hominissuis]MBZ4554332.1 HNH endonuclease [Mycobacterium avium subsp. hominissuis]
MTRRSGWQRGRPTASATVTRGYEWQRLRRRVLARDDYTCQIRLPGCVDEATEVDKCIPASVDPSLALDEDNCRATCKPCHRQVTARQAAGASKAARERRKRPPRVHPSDVLLGTADA